jgi:hypothetical protein
MLSVHKVVITLPLISIWRRKGLKAKLGETHWEFGRGREAETQVGEAKEGRKLECQVIATRKRECFKKKELGLGVTQVVEP